MSLCVWESFNWSYPSNNGIFNFYFVLFSQYQELPERYQEDYQNAAKQRTAQFMTVLKNVAEGDDPATASRKLREQLEKEAQKNPPVPTKSS